MIEYKKMQSNGNNFLLLDNRGLHYDADTLVKYTIRDCDIKKGIGADGMLVIEPSSVADFKMRIINSNGFESEMCGNGSRCIALYAYEKGIADYKMSFETLAGIIRADVKENIVKIGMGIYEAKGIETVRTFDVLGQTIKYQYMEVGVPHVIVFWEDNFEFDRGMMRQV
ncbi:MAG TPA: diaminopimelate epimerase, partial [Clostridiales bacterium UBA8960]|nr:diaminopimelate epimerase [Clostridiales bacterium UBA8960]